MKFRWKSEPIVTKLPNEAGWSVREGEVIMHLSPETFVERFSPSDEEAAHAMIAAFGGMIFSLKPEDSSGRLPDVVDVWPGAFKIGYDRYIYLRSAEDFEALAKEFGEIRLRLRENDTVGIEI